MSIKEFAAEVKVVLEERTGKEVRIQEVTKNNGVILHGINIIEPGINVTPTIYVESFFINFENGRSLEEIAERILEIYQKDKMSTSFNMEWFRDFENVKDKVAYKLVNFETNKELLEQVPYEKVLDLVKVYYVSVDTKEFGHGTILIYNTHLDLWGITAEQLRKIAEDNTPKLFPAETMWMGDIIDELYTGDDEEIKKEIEEMKKQCPMYVMSNQQRVFGAAAMCYPDSVKYYAEQMDGDIYIIPSSTHEVIMVPKILGADVESLKSMVYEVNRTQVADEEVLSDSIYVYNRENDSIAIA